MGPEHYLSKIERNAVVVDKAPAEIKEKCIKNIVWARNLSKRLELLDYHEREEAIDKIHEVMDLDYVSMGYAIPNLDEKRKVI